MFNHIPFNHNQHISHIYTHKNGANLWVGDVQAANDLMLLNRLDINAGKYQQYRQVLTAAQQLKISYKNDINNKYQNKQQYRYQQSKQKQKQKQREREKDKILRHKYIQHLIIKAVDMPSYNIRQHFAQSNKFIQQNLNKGHNVLVHCAVGISRSVTLIIAFLIRKLYFNFKNALIHVQSRRSIAYPNYGFIQQLKLYQEQIQNKIASSSVRNNTQPYIQKAHNQISQILTRRKIKQKQKLRYAFEDRLSLNKKSIQTALAKYSSQKYQIKQSYKQKSKSKHRQSQKVTSKSKSNQKTIKLQKIQIKQTRKRIDIENTILFPRIVLIKKLQKIQNTKRSYQ